MTMSTLARRILIAAALTALQVGVVGCLDPIVGYPCAPGHVERDGACVRTDAGPVGDGGGGGEDVDAGDARDAGDAGDAGDGRPGDGGDGGGTGGTGGSTGGSGGSTGGSGGSTGGSGGSTGGSGGATGGSGGATGGTGGGTGGAGGGTTDGQAGDGGVDVPGPGDGGQPGDGPDTDGGTIPDAPPPSDGAPPPDVLGPDMLVCMAPLTACIDRCVDLSNDPDNCGFCGNPCSSGLCIAGVCQLQGAGHLAIIGHDYTVGRVGINNLVGNAVFLANDRNVTVLAYEADATQAAINGTNAAINQVANQRGRGWMRTVAAAGDVTSMLGGYDIFLIYAQRGADDATLNANGAMWAGAMNAFLAAGKTIVLLDGASPSNTGTFRIAMSAGLFTAMARTEVTGQTLTVVSPGDALAPRVPLTYRAEVTSVAFTTAETNQVVRTMGGVPVVIHKTF
jgi:hypothetical protein